MRTLLSGCAAALILAGLTQAQMQKYWARYHNGTGNSEDYGYGMAVDAAGNTYVTGGATNALGVGEVVLVKYDAIGQKQWAVTYAGPGGGPDYGSKVEVDPAGNIVVSADTLGVGTDYDLTTLKYDPQGNLLWDRRFNGTGDGYDGGVGGWSLEIGPAGEVFIGGITYDAVNSYDSLILKYDASGALLWTAIYDGEDHLSEDNYDLVLDASGDVYAAVESTSIGTGRNILAHKYGGTDGALLWETVYSSPPAGSSDVVNAIDIDASANVYVVGYGPDEGTGDDMITMKVDTNGVLQWVRRYDGPFSNNDAPWDVAVGPTGLVAVTGVSQTRYDTSAATVAYDASGNVVFAQLFDASDYYFGDDEFFDVEFDAAGNVWVAGFGWDGPEHASEATVVKYAPNGIQLFADVHDGTAHGDETAFGLAVRGNDVHVGGLSQRGKRHVDTLALRYGPTLHVMGAPGKLEPASLGPLNLVAESEDASLPESVEPRPYRPRPGTPGRPERRPKSGLLPR